MGYFLLRPFHFPNPFHSKFMPLFFVQTWPPYLENGLGVKVSPKLFLGMVTLCLTRYSLPHRCVCLVWLMLFISLLKICSTTSTNFDSIFCFQSSLFSTFKNKHYKKSWLFRRPTWPKCSHWPNVMSILTNGLGHEKHMLHLIDTFA